MNESILFQYIIQGGFAVLAIYLVWQNGEREKRQAEERKEDREQFQQIMSKYADRIEALCAQIAVMGQSLEAIERRLPPEKRER